MPKTTTAAKKPATTAATKPASRAAKPKAARPPAQATKAAPANVPAPRGKPSNAPPPSALDSAALVLAQAPREGMSAKAMVEAMAAKGLWTSPGGKTPEATVYAGILREIGRKGKAARFRKIGRGRFALAQPAS